MARHRAIIIDGATPIICFDDATPIIRFDSIYIVGNAKRAEGWVTSTAHNGNFSNNNIQTRMSGRRRDPLRGARG